MATAKSIISLLGLLPGGRPLEFYDRVATSLEMRLFERRLSRPSTDEPAGWECTLDRLEAFFGPRLRSVLAEPALREIEERVRARMDEISSDLPFEAAFNADITMARCCYALCRLAAPTVVVETGVAYGTTSAFLLQAMRENGRGALHSLDRVTTPGREAFRFVGTLVPQELRGPWHLHFGASRRVLPGLLRKVGHVDLFVHDSDHSYWNMRREYATVWPHLPAGGILISDDVHGNQAFSELKESGPQFWTVTREMGKGYASFGIAVK